MNDTLLPSCSDVKGARDEITTIYYRDDDGTWYHALWFLPFDREAPLDGGTEGIIVRTEYTYPLRPTDPAVQELARALDAEAREALWKL